MKIAVCIPTYNRAGVIINAINSLTAQKKADFDIHIFDNCSTDDTEQVISRLNYKRIYYHKNASNIGFVGNTNKCLELYKEYDYIGILHSDDSHCGESVYNVTTVMNMHPEAGIIFSDANLVDHNQTIVKPGKTVAKFYKAGLEAVDRVQFAIPCSATFYNTKAIEKVGFYDPTFPYSADEEYNSRIAVLFNIVSMSMVIANHTLDENNLRIETWFKPDFISNYESMRRKMFEKTGLPEKVITKKINKYMSDVCLSITSTLLKNSYTAESKRYWYLTLKYNPSSCLNPTKLVKLLYFKMLALK